VHTGLEKAQNDAEYLAWREALKKLPKSKRANRKIAQALTTEFNVLSGTMTSVQECVAHLADLLSGIGSGPERREFSLALITTAVSNAVEMMVDTPRFGFPVAMVLTSMFAKMPELPGLFHGAVKSSQTGCPLCVPQFVPHEIGGKALDTAEWKRLNGYRFGALLASCCVWPPLASGLWPGLLWPLASGSGLLRLLASVLQPLASSGPLCLTFGACMHLQRHTILSF
jgi:hypothetical protein